MLFGFSLYHVRLIAYVWHYCIWHLVCKNSGFGLLFSRVVTFMEKVKQVLILHSQDDIRSVVNFYKEVYKAVVETESCYPVYVELQFRNSTIAVTTKADGITAATSETMFELECDGVNDSFKAAMDAGAVQLTDPISKAEYIRGVKFKVRDPFGFTCALKEKTGMVGKYLVDLKSECGRLETLFNSGSTIDINRVWEHVKLYHN